MEHYSSITVGNCYFEYNEVGINGGVLYAQNASHI
jgi:predicted outer membrane repeat protein